MSAAAGYSGTPLARKLGIKDGHAVLTVRAPAELPAWLDPLPPAVRLRSRAGGAADVVLAFCTSRRQLAGGFAGWSAAAAPAGAVWIAWPKRSSGVATDLTEDVLREVVLPTGWVDTKVCAVSEVWSGLRFQLRRELR